MSKYELSLASNYVADWTIVEAVREFFQNALDQQAVQDNNEMFFHYDGVHLLQIGNKSSVLSANTLLLGVSSKQGDTRTIGQFGEGYKVATLVALRTGKKVIFYNYGKGEIWQPRMVKSRKYDGAEILTFETKKFIWNKPPHSNLIIAIDNITPEDWENIVEVNLHCQEDLGEVVNTPIGRILLDPTYKGKVFVNGLFVCNYDYHYGYDFLPEHIKMDRDRKLISDFDLRWLASKMWSTTNSTKITELARLGAQDVAFIEYQTLQVTPVNMAYREFRDTFGEDAVPVTSQEQVEDYKRKSPQAKPIIVTNSYRHLVKSSQDYQDPPEQEEAELSAIERLAQWFESVKDILTQEQQDQFNRIVDDL